jgi:hypothetical protein
MQPTDYILTDFRVPYQDRGLITSSCHVPYCACRGYYIGVHSFRLDHFRVRFTTAIGFVTEAGKHQQTYMEISVRSYKAGRSRGNFMDASMRSAAVKKLAAARKLTAFSVLVSHFAKEMTYRMIRCT